MISGSRPKLVLSDVPVSRNWYKVLRNQLYERYNSIWSRGSVDQIMYLSLRTFLTQFYINLSRQGHQKELVLVAINVNISSPLPLTSYLNSSFRHWVLLVRGFWWQSPIHRSTLQSLSDLFLGLKVFNWDDFYTFFCNRKTLMYQFSLTGESISGYRCE